MTGDLTITVDATTIPEFRRLVQHLLGFDPDGSWASYGPTTDRVSTFAAPTVASLTSSSNNGNIIMFTFSSIERQIAYEVYLRGDKVASNPTLEAAWIDVVAAWDRYQLLKRLSR